MKEITTVGDVLLRCLLCTVVLVSFYLWKLWILWELYNSEHPEEPCNQSEVIYEYNQEVENEQIKSPQRGAEPHAETSG